MIGAHASFTLSDESLDRLAGAVRETGSSMHVHVAEDRADVEDARERYQSSVPERLERHGLLGARTLLRALRPSLAGGDPGRRTSRGPGSRTTRART